jgi:hypothetical protein
MGKLEGNCTLSLGKAELNDRLAAISPSFSPFGRTWRMEEKPLRSPLEGPSTSSGP